MRKPVVGPAVHLGLCVFLGLQQTDAAGKRHHMQQVDAFSELGIEHDGAGHIAHWLAARPLEHGHHAREVQQHPKHHAPKHHRHARPAIFLVAHGDEHGAQHPEHDTFEIQGGILRGDFEGSGWGRVALLGGWANRRFRLEVTWRMEGFVLGAAAASVRHGARLHG